MSEARDIAYHYLMRFVGLPYKWGGDDPIAGFDCSGLAVEFLKSQGLVAHGEDLSAQALYNRYSTRPTTLSKFGTLIFYGAGPKSVTHVTIGLNGFTMVEAGGGGSGTKTVQNAIDQNAFVRLRPIANRTDLVGMMHPNYGWSD